MVGTPAHPGFTKVELRGGTVQGKVRPWTMAQRAEIKPALAAILQRVEKIRGTLVSEMSLPEIFMEAEEEIAVLCRASVELPEGTVWDDLLWEDLANIAQAVWETNIVTGAGGGLAGKLLGLLSPVLQASGASRAELSVLDVAALNSSLKPTEPPQSSPGLHS